MPKELESGCAFCETDFAINYGTSQKELDATAAALGWKWFQIGAWWYVVCPTCLVWCRHAVAQLGFGEIQPTKEVVKSLKPTGLALVSKQKAA